MKKMILALGITMLLFSGCIESYNELSDTEHFDAGDVHKIPRVNATGTELELVNASDINSGGTTVYNCIMSPDGNTITCNERIMGELVVDYNINANHFNGNNIGQGYVLGIYPDQWAFCVLNSVPDCSGLKFINTGRRGFDFTISKAPIAHFGVANGLGAFWIPPRNGDPTAGSQDRNEGTMYVKNIGTFKSNIISDGNALTINVGTFSAPQFERVGARQVDLNLSMKLNLQSGTDRCAGMAILVNGTATVNTSCIQDKNSMVMLTKQGQIGAGISPLQVENKINGTSFDIRDSNTNGDANVFWTISRIWGA